MIANLSRVFNSLFLGKFSGTLERYSGPTFTRGKETPTYASAVDVEYFSIPDSIDKLELSEDAGAQILVNRHFYFEGIFNIKDKDRLTHDGVTYEIRGIEPRPHGGFTYAYGKSVERTDV